MKNRFLIVVLSLMFLLACFAQNEVEKMGGSGQETALAKRLEQEERRALDNNSDIELDRHIT